jgi:hypothetical protein
MVQLELTIPRRPRDPSVAPTARDAREWVEAHEGATYGELARAMGVSVMDAVGLMQAAPVVGRRGR